MKRLVSCHVKVHVNGLWSLFSMVRSFQATLFHLIVRSFHTFSVKLNVEHACFAFLAKRMRYFFYTLVSACGFKARERFSLYYCRMINWKDLAWMV